MQDPNDPTKVEVIETRVSWHPNEWHLVHAQVNQTGNAEAKANLLGRTMDKAQDLVLREPSDWGHQVRVVPVKC